MMYFIPGLSTIIHVTALIVGKTMEALRKLTEKTT